MARSRDYLNNGGYENVDTSTSNNGAYSTQQTTHQMSSAPAATTQNTSQTSASKPGKYSFNGNIYGSYEAAQKAQQAHQQKVQFAQAMNEADLASVNYDFNKYNTLKSSGQLLSQISDDEWQYITKLQKTDTSPTSYTKSVRDKYLSSLGLPSAKDLNKYRIKYAEYASSGGIKDVYGGMDDDELEFIKKRFGEDTVAGFNGDRIPKDTKNGKPIEYADTLLDTELKANGMPSSALMNVYHAEYLNKKEKEAHINDFYEDVFKAQDNGADARTAWYSVLNSKKYADLVGLYQSTANISEPATATANEEDEDLPFTQLQPQTSSPQQAYRFEEDDKTTKNNLKELGKTEDFYASNGLRISQEDYERYAIRRTREIREEKKQEKRKEIAANFQSAITTPATTAEEKNAQRQAIINYFGSEGITNAAGNSVDVDDYNGYLNLLNAGVPAEVLANVSSNGVVSIEKWNDTANSGNPQQWAKIRSMLDGVSEADGDYASNQQAYIQTRNVSNRSDFAETSAYDPILYENQTSTSAMMSTSRNNMTVVSAEGALYAAVNGKQYNALDSSASPEDRDLLRDFTETNGDMSYADYMTDEEKGVFNTLFRKNPEQAKEYLRNIEPLIEKRQTGSLVFADSQERQERVAYAMNLRSVDRSLDEIKEGETTYWQKEAWDKYRDYSDESLVRIIEQSSKAVARGDGLYGIDSADREEGEMVSAEEALADREGTLPDITTPQETLRAAQFVYDKRQQAKDDAAVTSLLYGYTEAEGKAATEQVKGDIYGYRETTRLVNGVISQEGYREGMTSGEAVGALLRHGWREMASQTLMNEMTEEQKNRYNWLAVNKGEEAAQAYYDALKSELDASASKKISSAYHDLSGDNVLSNAAAFLGSVAAMPFTGMFSVGGSILNAMTGTELTRAQATTWDITGGIREGISSNIVDAIPNDDLGAVADFLFNVTASSADSTLGYVLSSGVPIMGELCLSMSAYSSSLRQGLDRGLSTEDATALATTSAIAEFITEHLGIDGVTKGLEKVAEKSAERGANGLMLLLQQAGIQFVPEALEEGVGNVMNTAFDYVINGDKSQLIETYNAAIRNGHTQEEATKLAALDFAKETALEMLAGGLAGAGSTVSGGMMNFAKNGKQEFLNALARRAMPDVVPSTGKHAYQFANGGSSIITELYGSDMAEGIQTWLDTRESVQDAERIDKLAKSFRDIDSASGLYDVFFDESGRSRLSRDQKTALATMLYMDGAQANVASIEATYIREQASKQSVAQREANTSLKNIKTNQELRNARQELRTNEETIKNTQQENENTRTRLTTDIEQARAKADWARNLSAVRGTDEAYRAEFSAREELKNAMDALTKWENGQNIADQNTIRQARQQVRSISDNIDKHFASLDWFLTTATSNRSFFEADYNNAQQRVSELGQLIDNMMSADFSDAINDSWLATLQAQLADAEDNMQRLENRMSKSSPTSLPAALNAQRRGTVLEYASTLEPVNSAVKQAEQSKAKNESNEQASTTATPEETGSANAEQASPEQTENTEQQTEQKPAETKTETKKAKPKKSQKKTFNISKTAQQRFSKIAKRFGCEVVWQTSAEIGGNGKYDPNTPNRIYLATDMIAQKGLPTDMVVAREFFTHEIVHYVANTKMYQRLSLLAERWYRYDAMERGYDPDDYFEAIIQDRITWEREHHNRDFTREQAREELTAVFAQDVLFKSENKNSLTWLTRTDKVVTSNFLQTVEYLIKRGNVRKMKDGVAVKTLLIDSERTLALALSERQKLDAAGLSSAFSNGRKTEQKTTAQPVEEQKTSQPAESATAESTAEEQQTQPTDLWSMTAPSDPTAAVTEALRAVNPELADMASNGDGAVTTAIQNIAKSVARSQASPMAAATYLSETFKADGVNGLEDIFEYQTQGDASTAYLSPESFSEVREIDDMHADEEGNPNESGMAATMSGDNSTTTDADEAIEKSSVLVNKDGEAVMNVINNGNAVMFSDLTYEIDGKAALEKYLAKRREEGFIDKSQEEYIKSEMDRIYNLCKEYEGRFASFGQWSRASVEVTDEGEPVFSVIRSNSEYPMNIDFSLVCVKRRALNEVFNKVIENGDMESIILDDQAIVLINEAIRESGYETACTMCFVEAKRFQQAKAADRFVNKYNDLVKSLGGNADYFNFGGNSTIQQSEGIRGKDNSELNFSKIDKIIEKYQAKKKAKPGAGMTVEEAIAFELRDNPASRRLVQRGDFMSSKGFDAVAKNAPNVLKLYNKQKGTGGPKASFGDMQYLNDIENKNWSPEKAYSVGGVRVQSFSDFVPNLAFDYVQMIADLAGGNLPAHAYTKEKSFARLFGLTGMKINLSLVPMVGDAGAGLNFLRDANGNVVLNADGDPVTTYAWAKESFDYDAAVQIQSDPQYGKNCGTIAIGVSDAQIRQMLNDPSIRMIIPYHKSSLNPVVARMEKIAEFKDYTKVQRTKGTNGKALNTDFPFNDTLRRLGDPRAAADEYLAWCDARNYTPKFSEFRAEPNYYKLLEDFTLFDEQGNYAPQGAVQMKYPAEYVMDDNGNPVLDENGNPVKSPFGSFADILAKSLSDYEQFRTISDEATEALAQKVIDISNKRKDDLGMYSEGATVEDLASSYTPQESLADLKRIFNGSPDTASDVEYMRLAEAYKNGDKSDEEKLRQLVDDAAHAAGYNYRGYHGTNASFTVFDPNKLGSKNFMAGSAYLGFFASKSKETAESYTGLNSLDFASLSLNAEAARLMDESKARYDYDNRAKQYDEAKERFEDEYRKNNGYDEVVTNVVDSVIASAKEQGLDLDLDVLAKTVRTYQEIEWNKEHLNQMYQEWYNSQEYKEFKEVENAIWKDWEQSEIKRRGYTPHVKSLYIKLENPLVYDFKGEGRDTESFAARMARAKEEGRDGCIFENVEDGAELDTIYAVFDNTQFKSADLVTYDNEGNIIPLSERFNEDDQDIRYSTGDTIEDFISEYGLKQQSKVGEANNIRTPEYVRENVRVSDVAQTLKEAASEQARERIDDILVEALDETQTSPIIPITQNTGLLYKPMTMGEMLQQGVDYITEAGSVDEAMRRLAREIPIAKLTDLTKLEAAAMAVFSEIANTTNFDPNAYGEFVAAIGIMNGQWGRMGKAMQLLHQSPIGRRKYMEKVVERINQENAQAMSKGLDKALHPNGVKQIEIDESLYKDLEMARTPEEVRKAEFRISEEIGKQSPLTVENALRNWRYFAMLANPVTHWRNILGNVSMLGMRSAKDVVAAGLESAAVKTKLMKESDRTHYFSLKNDPKVKDFALQMYLDNAEAVQGNDRFGVKDKMRDAVKKSPIKWIDKLMRFNGTALESEDAWFLRATYVAAASQYINAKGLDVDKMTNRQKAEVNQYATQQAQEATYRDASEIADVLNSIARRGKAWQFAVESVMPFKKTPVNIAKRGIEYSPAGLIKGVADLVRSANGKSIPASKIVDELSKGLVGSAVTLLGYWLAKAGILKINAGDDDKTKTLNKDAGHQDYSIEIGNYSFKIESIAPMTFPLFAGASLYKTFGENGIDPSKGFQALTQALMGIADPLMDMSFMSSLNSTLNTYNQSKILGVAENMLTSYASQFLPTVIGKANNVLTPTRRTTKSSASAKEGLLGSQGDYTLRSFATKIPGGTAFLEPYVKVTGETDTKDSFGDYMLSFANNFLSPVNVSVIDTDPAMQEISRIIGQTGATNFVPSNPQKYFKYQGETYNLTASEYTDYAKDHNETVYAALTETMMSPEYARATDEQRATMLYKAYDSAHTAMMKKWKAIIVAKRTKE